MDADVVLQQTSNGFGSSTWCSSTSAKNYSEADFMSGTKGKSGVYIRTKPVWNKGKKCPQTSMERNGSWKGGKINRQGGYIEIKEPTNPSANQEGYIKEHRKVMQEFIGRLLLKKEVVHHINGDTSDNRIENLKLFKNHSEHIRHHQENIISKKIIIHCQECNKDILIYPYLKNKQKFCSVLCSNRSKRQKPWKKKK